MYTMSVIKRGTEGNDALLKSDMARIIEAEQNHVQELEHLLENEKGENDGD